MSRVKLLTVDEIEHYEGQTDPFKQRPDLVPN